MNIIETVDFNDDTQFLGKDLDISWCILTNKNYLNLVIQQLPVRHLNKR